MCYLLESSILIILVSTIHLVQFFPANFVFYVIWVASITFTQSGMSVISPSILAKCFGQKHFSKIIGMMTLLAVGYY